MIWPPAFLAVAEKTWVLPTSIEKLTLGFSETLDTPSPPGPDVLLPRQEDRVKADEITINKRMPVEQLRMNPPRVLTSGRERNVGWKAASVEGNRDIEQACQYSGCDAIQLHPQQIALCSRGFGRSVLPRCSRRRN
jgi:hypothetical protein